LNGSLVSSIYWHGQTLFYSTERHLCYLTQSKSDNSGVLFGFNSHDKANPNIISSILSDRVTLAFYKGPSSVTFLTKHVLLLEPLLLGYLSSTKHPHPDTIKRLLTYLDCAHFSAALINALDDPSLTKFLLGSPFVCPSQFDLSLSLDCPDSDTLFEQLFAMSTKLEDLMLHKLKNEADFSLEKAILRAHLDKFRRNGQYLSAVRCAEKLQDYQAVAEIAGRFGEIRALEGINQP